MTASELIRQLLFYGYEEVTDYLKNSPLNRYLYKQFLNLLPAHNIEVPMVSLFNEIYFQCVHVNYDGSPGVDIGQRYLSESEAWLESQSATQVVFASVWAILNNKRKMTFNEECFLSQLTPYIKNGAFFDYAAELKKAIQWVGMEVPDPFPTMTCPIDGIPKFEVYVERRSLTNLINASIEKRLSLSSNFFELQEHTAAWQEATCNYSHAVIENLVRLYSTPSDQLELIERIQRTLPREEVINLDGFLKDLVGKIKTGNFGLDNTRTSRIVGPDDFAYSEEYDEYRYNLALDRAATDVELNREEQLKRDCEALQRELDDLKKSHELEIAKLEALHSAEIKRLKRERIKLTHETTKNEPLQEGTSSSDELTFSINEIVSHVKGCFSRAGGDEVSTMLYHLAVNHGYLAEDTFKLIDSIKSTIIQRDKPQQNVDITTAHQVYVSPQNVNNYTKEER